MRKRTLSLALALVMALGLAAPALAFTTPDFTDLPSDNWAYEPVMRMADAGVIKGTGGGAFSPEMKVSVAQFLTLVGRVVFPDVKAEGADWYGPYIQEAQSKGLLNGTQVDTSKPEAEISRYDMAVILRGAAKQLGVPENAAQPSQVTDYGEIPTKYAEAVLAVYGMGLIQGDQNGNFNGANTMMRNETATVMDRLIALKGDAKPGPGGTTPPEPSSEPNPQPSENPELPTEPVIITARAWGSLYYYPTQGNGSWDRDATKLVGPNVPFKIFFTEDGGETSTFIIESESEGTGQFELEFPMDKRLLDNPNGQFYLSAQVEKDGQLFVTQDLRTDGRQTLCPVKVYEKGHGIGGGNIELVPPTGQRWNFDLEGIVPKRAQSTEDESNRHDVLSRGGITVQLVYYPEPNLQNGIPTGERIILGETISNEDGTFTLPVSVDTLDRDGGKSYRIEMQGVSNGQIHRSCGTDDLRTLGDIKTELINSAWGVHLEYDP